MITIRNPMECQSITVIAGAALKVGQAVKLVQGTAAGEPPQVVAPDAADYKDATLHIGVVYYVQDDDEAVDYTINPSTSVLTVNTGSDATTDIPSGAHCTFWFDRPIVGITDALFTSDAGSTLALTSREGTKVAFNATDELFDTYDAADIDVSDTFQGTIIATDGAELTILLSEI